MPAQILVDLADRSTIKPSAIEFLASGVLRAEVPSSTDPRGVVVHHYAPTAWVRTRQGDIIVEEPHTLRLT